MNQRTISATLIVLLLLLIVAVLGACGPVSMLVRNAQHDMNGAAANAAAMPGGGMHRGGGQGMGMHMEQGSGMMARHHAAVPAAYADLSNPVAADDASLARGEGTYTTLCASCHGDTGMGDGPAGQALDPAPAPIAHTSQMMSDGYLFWRVTEGGSHFSTAMPVWQEVLDEQARWDVINYIRALGSDAALPRGRGPQANRGVGENHTQMLLDAVTQGVITQDDADLFERVHAVLDEQLGAGRGSMDGAGPRGMQAMQRAFTEQAVRNGLISQEDADRFAAIHDLLIEAGLMQ